MNIFVLLPILVPLLIAIGVLLARRHPHLQRNLSLGGAVVIFVAAVQLLLLVWRDGVRLVQVGSWSAPLRHHSGRRSVQRSYSVAAGRRAVDKSG